MNDRKQHVIKMSHQLFIDKGFQATSIQDILDYSGISKGTFYNYFSSKSELLIALFKAIYTKMEQDRNELLIGQDPSSIEIFIKQIELQINTNKKNKLIALFEEVLVSNDPDLKQFIKMGQLRNLQWIYKRFLEIFGENKRIYLLDCAIMFIGILHHNVKYYVMANGSNTSMHQVVSYSVERVVNIVNEVAASGEQLIKPEILENWLPENNRTDQVLQLKLTETILALKKSLCLHEEHENYNQLIDFIQDELLQSKKPRKFLIENSLLPLNNVQDSIVRELVEKLTQLVANYFLILEEID
ncbi:TetR/AcrR family transcriptional regulator [Metabacillus bambusae]|uniref:TetR/AcrR family transcriptional regulator n=1 Tax=Metabacillus bambusae TaxID=2795218 RepID=A0ABS3N4Q4_9BACI|nr:TetR/AcrR family transcriptional regulator [Metabacillus bambusae]MBO1513277.1 TetR/AcrR family transcriptional regulator [Metabacillus bambusae]